MQWYLQVLKKYAVFNGRARREEFWMFALFNFVFIIIARMLDSHFGTSITALQHLPNAEPHYGWVYCIYMLLTLIPTMAVTFRRLHDVGKSGVWALIIYLSFIPDLLKPNCFNTLYTTAPIPTLSSLIILFAIWIWLITMLSIEGNICENKYGSDPKAISKAEAINN